MYGVVQPVIAIQLLFLFIAINRATRDDDADDDDGLGILTRFLVVRMMRGARKCPSSDRGVGKNNKCWVVVVVMTSDFGLCRA